MPGPFEVRFKGIEIQKNGQPFYKNDGATWSNMDEADVALLEGLLIQVEQQLNDVAKAKAGVGGSDHPGKGQGRRG